MRYWQRSNNSDSMDEIRRIKNEYYDIRKRVFDDLKRCGRCQIFDDVMEHVGESMIYLDFIAAKDAYTAYIEKNELTSEPDDYYSGTKRGWLEIAGRTILIDRNMLNTVAVFRDNAWKRYVQLERRDNGSDVSQNQNSVALNIVENAKEEAKRIVEAAKFNADRLINEANSKKEKIIQDAKDEAEFITSDAKITKKQLVDEGERKKRTLIEEGEAEKQRIIEEISDEEYRSGCEARIKEHFRNEQLEERKIRKDLDENYDAIIKARNDMLNGMNKEAQVLHTSLMTSFDSTLSKLQNIQNDIHSQLDTWQRSLYKNELQSLAMCFMNLDKIVSSTENKIATHLAFGEEGYHKELADELSRIVKNLKILKGNFESGLAKNSIKLLIPTVGERFNSNYHKAENYDPMTEDEDSLNGKAITAVSDPGLIRVLNSGDEIMQRAVVTVEK